jgi:hypothetical protein
MRNWQCSLCHTLTPDGAKICTGCGGRVSYKIERQIVRAIFFSLIGALGFSDSLFFGFCGITCGVLLAFIIPISKEPTISPP